MLLAIVLLLLAIAPVLAATPMYGLLWYGQSLSVGAFGLPLLTPFAPLPYTLMMHNNVTGLYSINQGKSTSQVSTAFDSLVPAYDQYFSSLANTSPGQTPATPMAEALSLLENAPAAAPYFMTLLSFGVGGYNYSQLASGQTPYANLTNGITGAVNLMPLGFALNVPAVMYVQGEADAQAGTSRSAYASDLAALQSSLSSSIETATSQTNTPPLLITQETNSTAFGGLANSQNIWLGQWDAAVNNPSVISLVMPLYPLENNAQQSGHLTARGYFYMGEYMARAYRAIVPTAQGGLNGTWKAPMPVTASITNSGNIVSIPYTGGTSPYVFDCSQVSSPNGAADGFHYTDNSGSPPGITSVSVTSNGTTIQLTLSGTPAHGVTAAVEYANSSANGEGTLVPGPVTGLRGCLHDSDPYTSILDSRPLPNYSIAWSSTFTTN